MCKNEKETAAEVQDETVVQETTAEETASQGAASDAESPTPCWLSWSL